MFSFGFIIFTGAALLKLPNATTTPITFVDALFTSTSAVCVTGLIVVDTATQFTALGQEYYFNTDTGWRNWYNDLHQFLWLSFSREVSSSFSERLVLSDFFSEDNVSEIRKTLDQSNFYDLNV